MKTNPVRFVCHRLGALGLGAMLALLFGGCASSSYLTVKPQPGTAVVTIVDAAGKPVKAADGRYEVFGKPDARYTVRATPSPGDAERFAEATRALSSADYQQLTVVKENVRELPLALPVRNYLLLKLKPANATVTVVNATGQTLPAVNGRYEVFGRDEAVYTVRATPADAERHDPVSSTLALGDYQKLAQVKENVRELALTLPEKNYESMPSLALVLDEKGRMRSAVTPARAFKEIAEVGGAVPARVLDLGENLGISGFSISPDGSRLVFAVATYKRQLTDILESFALNEDRLVDLAGCNLRSLIIQGGGVQQITAEDFRDFDPSFTPDGEFLLFSSNRRRPQYADLLRIRAAGRSGISNINVGTRPEMYLRPTQAGNGTIAFAVVPEGVDLRESQIWTVGGANQFPTQITKGNQPSISPDGSRIAYVGADENLWVTNADGSQETQLTTGAERIVKQFVANLTPSEKGKFLINEAMQRQQVRPFSYPSWSPDGKLILFTSMEGNDPTGRPNEDIWMMRFDGSDKQQLTTNGSADRFPVMSAKDGAIFFLSNRGKTWAIWRIKSPLAN